MRSYGLLAQEIETGLRPRIKQEDPLTLHEFTHRFWPVIENRLFVDNWHIGLMCEFLQAITYREIMRGIINIPPRFMKSTLVNVMWPAWVWGEEVGPRGASEQFFFSSYGSDLVLRDSERCRVLIKSGAYQLKYHDIFDLSRGQNSKSFYTNTRTGYRLCTSVGGAGTGKGGDILCIDDPLKIEEAGSEVIVQAANDWYDVTFSQRKNDPKSTAILLIMQRLVPNDLTGHIITSDESDDWVVLRIPNEFEHDFKCYVFFDGERLRNPVKPLEKLPEYRRKELDTLPRRRPEETLEAARERMNGEFVYMADPRTEDMELLWKHRFDSKSTTDAKKRLRGKYAGQYQQRPVPLTGGAVKEEWFKFWVPEGDDITKYPPHSLRLEDGTMHFCDQINIPRGFADKIQSWDLGFKAVSGSSRCSGQVWGRWYQRFFLIDNDTRHLNVMGAIKAIIRMTQKHPDAYGKLIEDKANGPAVMQMLRGKLAGMIPINPVDSKEARVNAISYLFEAGDVYLPHPLVCPWVYDFMAEFTSFPGTYTDQVDATAQALLRLALQVQELDDDVPMSITQTSFA